MSDFKREMKAILLAIHEEQQAQRSLLEQVMRVCVESNAEISTQRARLIEQASRHGGEIHEHEKALIHQDVRITRIERRLDPEHADAE